MFTGLVEKMGKVRRVTWSAGLVVEIGFSPWGRPLEKGESVAVNGVCLTVADRSSDRFTADVLLETARRTSIASLKPGDAVNLERALRAGDPMGGHIVQGHVDKACAVASVTPRGRDFRMTVSCGRALAAMCVEKGSVAVDGVSLTITGVGPDWFSVDVIPTTARDTTLGRRRAGDLVNIETDVIGKYLRKPDGGTGVTEQMLADAGFL